MIHKAKKKAMFFFGMLTAGIAGMVGSYLRTHISKSESLLTSFRGNQSPFALTAHADISSGAGCFPSGTLISTPSGTKEIQLLSVGDLVNGFDAETGVLVTAPVLKTLKHSWEEVHTRSPLLIITHERGVITLTENHWVYRRNSRGGEYTHFDRAGMLEVGDVLTLEDGTESVITGIKDGPVYDFVYNLNVDRVHTYCASGVRVHNDDDGDGDGGGGGGGDDDDGDGAGADAGCGSDSCDDMGSSGDK